MDFVSEKSALEVDEIRVDEKATGRLPSRPSGESASVESAVEDADDEVSPPIVMSEEGEPARVHIVVYEELWPPIAKVAFPFTVIVNFDAVPRLANAALPQHSVSHLLVLHYLHELGWKAETVLAPGEHRDNKGGPPFGRGIGQRLERRQRRLKPRWTSRQRSRRSWPNRSRGSGRKDGKSLLVLATWRSSTAASQ
jgi:hypothetical protein